MRGVWFCLLMLLTSYGAQAQVTRTGPYVGARHIAVHASVADAIMRAGIGEPCLSEAMNALSTVKMTDMTYDSHATLDILCAFNVSNKAGATDVTGKPIGRHGTVGGVKYVLFASKTKVIQRYFLTRSGLPPLACRLNTVCDGVKALTQQEAFTIMAEMPIMDNAMAALPYFNTPRDL